MSGAGSGRGRAKNASHPGSDKGSDELSRPLVQSGADETASEGRFAEAMRDVKPLAHRHKVRPRRSAVAVAPRRPPEREAIAFEFPRPGEPRLGHAGGIQRRQLERLLAGRIRPESSIDLHRLQVAEARAVLHRRLTEAHDTGERCLVVIHGRGLHSERDSVLKRALPSWLTDSKVAHLVLAFAPARPKDGGEGATYVLLRKLSP